MEIRLLAIRAGAVQGICDWHSADPCGLEEQFSGAQPTWLGYRAQRTYEWIIAQTFASVYHGYLACVAGLVLVLVIACRIRDVKAVLAALSYGFAALFCLFLSNLISHPVQTR